MNRATEKISIRTGIARLSVLMITGVLLAGCGGGSGGSSTPTVATSPTPSPSPTASPIGVYVGPASDGPSSDPAVCTGYTPAPKIDSVSPNSSPLAGGGVITIKGSGFSHCSPSVPYAVFGDTGPGTVLTFSDSVITVIAPKCSRPITIDVVVSVRNPSYGGAGVNIPTHGESAATAASKFVYE